MMVRLVEPQAGMRVYDPCSGSGGMLIYVHGVRRGARRGLPRPALYGQENNGATWAISKMNMILHGINNADIANERHPGRAPAHGRAGELLLFDRVLTNPPFSLNYDRRAWNIPERFSYGSPRRPARRPT